MERYSVLKKKNKKKKIGEILTHATQTAFCQVSQSYKGKYHTISKLHEKPSHQTCIVNNGYRGVHTSLQRARIHKMKT